MTRAMIELPGRSVVSDNLGNLRPGVVTVVKPFARPAPGAVLLSPLAAKAADPVERAKMDPLEGYFADQEFRAHINRIPEGKD